MALGVDGVQIASRFVTTRECDADIRYKEAYLNASKEDIVIVKSPVGMPGRAILNPFMKRVMLGEKMEHTHATDVWPGAILQRFRTASRTVLYVLPKEM